jgi:RNA polymerase sigma factor (sigma-70 family)
VVAVEQNRSAEKMAVASANTLERARAGDAEAFVTLVEQQMPSLYRFVARELRYHEALGNLEPGELTPEEVTDEVFLAARHHLREMPRRASLAGWLRHLALQVIRRAVQASRTRRNLERIHLEQALPDEQNLYYYYQPDASITWEDILSDRSMPMPEQVIEFDATWEILEEALNQLPPLARQVFILHAIEGLDLSEIAALEQRPIREIRDAYRAAREALRQYLVQKEEQP